MDHSELVEMMTEYGWTVPELAEKVGLSERVIIYYRSGERKIPGPTAIAFKQVLKRKKKAAA